MYSIAHMVRIGAAQITGWRARLTTGDVDAACDLAAAVEPLHRVAHEVEIGRRELAARYAEALERRLGSPGSPPGEREDHAERETRALVNRLRRLSGG